MIHNGRLSMDRIVTYRGIIKRKEALDGPMTGESHTYDGTSEPNDGIWCGAPARAGFTGPREEKNKTEGKVEEPSASPPDGGGVKGFRQTNLSA